MFNLGLYLNPYIDLTKTKVLLNLGLQNFIIQSLKDSMMNLKDTSFPLI